MKKRLLPVAVLATAAFGLTACAGGSNGGDGGDVSAEGETLNVWIMEGTNPDSDAFFDEVGEAFTEETGAKLDVEFVQWADAHDRFVTDNLPAGRFVTLEEVADAACFLLSPRASGINGAHVTVDGAQDRPTDRPVYP